MRTNHRLFLVAAAATLAAQTSGWTQFEKVPKWEISEGAGTAAQLSAGGKNFIQELRIARPEPATTADQLAAINPHLPELLPGFAALMAGAEVSTRFKEIYELKLKTLKGGGSLTPQNYFDLETALRLQDPNSKRKVLLVQTDMDVVTDGSDPVRAASLSDYDLARSSDWYQPTTSFGWAGAGAANPFLDYYPKALGELEKLRAELVEKSAGDQGVIWREMLKTCDAQIYRIKARGMGDSTRRELRARRFLLADRDPFVVLPRTTPVRSPWSMLPSTFRTTSPTCRRGMPISWRSRATRCAGHRASACCGAAWSSSMRCRRSSVAAT